MGINRQFNSIYNPYIKWTCFVTHAFLQVQRYICFFMEATSLVHHRICFVVGASSRELYHVCFIVVASSRVLPRACFVLRASLHVLCFACFVACDSYFIFLLIDFANQIQSSLIMFLFPLIDCGIRTKQETDLLPCDHLSCNLGQ